MRRGGKLRRPEAGRCGTLVPPEQGDKGNNMSDTIKLLETIGSDASLRYASADELNGVLKHAQASVELTMAVTTGDCATLRVELTVQGMPHFPQTQVPGQEDEEETDVPQPERPQPAPSPSPSPAKRSSSR